MANIDCTGCPFIGQQPGMCFDACPKRTPENIMCIGEVRLTRFGDESNDSPPEGRK
ncbi:MAG: hypothetical protein WCX71_01300 [Candidatus Buchananbacteria bacterium]